MNLILTQIKASLQVSYDLDQANTVTYDFIVNSMAAKDASIGDHSSNLIFYIKTCGKKSPENGFKRAGGAILTVFNPIGPIYWTERNNLSLTNGCESTSNAEGNKSPSTRKKSRAASIKSKNKSAQKIQCEISSLKSKWKKLEERGAQARKQMNLRTMRATNLVVVKSRYSKRGQTESLGVSCSIG